MPAKCGAVTGSRLVLSLRRRTQRQAPPDDQVRPFACHDDSAAEQIRSSAARIVANLNPCDGVRILDYPGRCVGGVCSK